jgi:hypothetical protein
MKKGFTIAVLLILLTLGVNAQITNINVAAEIGLNINKINKTAYGYESADMLRAGFHVGGMLNVGIAEHLAFQPGLRYIIKGGSIRHSYTSNRMNIATNDKLTLHYVEVPLNVVYKLCDINSGCFIIGGGPYVAVLLNAQDRARKFISTSDGTDMSSQEKYQSSMPIGQTGAEGNLRRMDVGVGGLVGYETLMGLYVKGGLQLGLVELQQNKPDYQFYNRNFNVLLTVGYYLGGNRSKKERQ